MKHSFGPHSVPPSSWRQWLKEALALSTKRWAANTGVGLLILGLLALIPQRWASTMLACLAPPTVALFAVIAHGTDGARSLRESVSEALPGILRVGVCAVGFIALIYAAIGTVIGLMLLLGATPNGSAPPMPLAIQASDFPAGKGALITLFLWLLVPLTFFLIPLLVCAQLPLGASISMSMDGYDMNPFIWRISALAGVFCLVAALWHGVAAVPFYPIIGAAMYVAYRHVFLNSPPSSGADNADAFATTAKASAAN